MFFFQNPQRSACSSLPRRGKEKEPEKCFVSAWVGSTPYTSLLRARLKPIAITKPHPTTTTITHTPVVQTQLQGSKYLYFLTLKIVVFFFLFLFWGGGEGRGWNPFNLGIYGIHNSKVSNSLTLCIVWIIGMSKMEADVSSDFFCCKIYHNLHEKNLRNFWFFYFLQFVNCVFFFLTTFVTFSTMVPLKPPTNHSM